MPKAEMTGALFFSKEHPQITGYLVIGGVEYEIAGWRATDVRSEIKARKRGAVAQEDFFDGARTADAADEGAGGASKASGERKEHDGVEAGAVHENQRL